MARGPRCAIWLCFILATVYRSGERVKREAMEAFKEYEEERTVNEVVKYAVNFLLGGTIVSVSTYLGSQGKTFLAAFASTFPRHYRRHIILIYLNGGNDASSATQKIGCGSSRPGWSTSSP